MKTRLPKKNIRVVSQKKITVSLADVLSPSKGPLKSTLSLTTTPIRVVATPVVKSQSTAAATSATASHTDDPDTATNWYVALFDFTGDANYHMMSGLLVGDVIRIVRRGESGWWWAHHMQRENGQVKVHEGYVPAEYLKPVQIEKPELIEPPEAPFAPKSTQSYFVELPSRYKDESKHKDKEESSHSIKKTDTSSMMLLPPRRTMVPTEVHNVTTEYFIDKTRVTNRCQQSKSKSKSTKTSKRHTTTASAKEAKAHRVHHESPRKSKSRQRRYRSHDSRHRRPRTTPSATHSALPSRRPPSTTPPSITPSTTPISTAARTVDPHKNASACFWQSWLTSNDSPLSRHKETRSKRVRGRLNNRAASTMAHTTAPVLGTQRNRRGRTQREKNRVQTRATRSSSASVSSQQSRISKQREPFRWTLRLPKSTVSTTSQPLLSSSKSNKSKSNRTSFSQKKQKLDKRLFEPRRRNHSQPPPQSSVPGQEQKQRPRLIVNKNIRNEEWTTVSYRKKQISCNDKVRRDTEIRKRSSRSRRGSKERKNRKQTRRNIKTAADIDVSTTGSPRCAQDNSISSHDTNGQRMKEFQQISKMQKTSKMAKKPLRKPAEVISSSSAASRPKDTLEMFRKVYGKNTTNVSVDPMAPMTISHRGRRHRSHANRRGRSAPPVQRNRFWVPPLETDYEISLKVVRGIARDGDISLQESLTATHMLLQRDSVMLNALGISAKDAQFSEDMENDDESMKRMAQFMVTQRHNLVRMKKKVYRE